MTDDNIRQVFQTEDGDQVFVPVGVFTWNEAQAEAKRHVAEFADEWTKAVYASTKVVQIHADCDWPYCADEGRPVRCYVFEAGER